MNYRIVPVTLFEQNCTLLWCEQTGEAAIVDPGGEEERIVAAIREEGVTPVKILLTHGHIDHVGGAAALAERLGIPVLGPHRDETRDRVTLHELARVGAEIEVTQAVGVVGEKDRVHGHVGAHAQQALA